ncbi:lipid storage droplets surface-binding protein 2-like [Ceratina calcarata]|uniref:Lipid storage droplets surface-binding protein 2-like n=1 Tax=Ceratina calcarata TaxID=156304 RepID=A0AAJ7N7D7_9HYME|nr:lipid storage droplets surface-binding protein 2-like [Ceratina calcarata]
MGTGTEVIRLPEIKVFHRVYSEVPMIETAISRSFTTYSRIKDRHQLLNWALTTAETSLTSAGVMAVVPIAKKLENPIQFIDHTLCLGLDKIEEKVPMVREKPEQILENACAIAKRTMQPAVSTISLANELIISNALSLGAKSWSKANQLLETQYGNAAIRGFDSTADVVDKIIDKYFPATGDEESIVINTEDKLLHTLQTLGRLSNKAARRVYSHVTIHLETIKPDNLKSYVNYVVQFLQLTSRHTDVKANDTE